LADDLNGDWADGGACCLVVGCSWYGDLYGDDDADDDDDDDEDADDDDAAVVVVVDVSGSW